jgi:putative nucleotidyltransferase-like protein
VSESLGILEVTDATISLLWEACRREPDVAAIRSAAERDLQAELVVALALGHRIGPLLWRAVDTAGCADALGTEGDRLRELADTFRMQALVLHPQAVAMSVEPLTAVGLEPLIMKGPTLIDRYPEPGLRPMDDVDLLLPPEDHNRAVRTLTAAGWTVSRPRARGLYDTQFRHPDLPSMPLELHYGLEGWHEKSNRLDPRWVWQQRVPIDCLGTSAFGLPLEVELVSLAAHAGKPYHGFDRLIWLADLSMATSHAQQHDGVDWDRVMNVARSTECVTVVSAALQMATRMGLDMPKDKFPLPTSGWRSVPLGRLLNANWPVAHGAGTFHVRFALVDSRWRRVVLFVAGSRNFSWSERVHLPQRATARVIEVVRESRSGPGARGTMVK